MSIVLLTPCLYADYILTVTLGDSWSWPLSHIQTGSGGKIWPWLGQAHSLTGQFIPTTVTLLCLLGRSILIHRTPDPGLGVNCY